MKENRTRQAIRLVLETGISKAEAARRVCVCASSVNAVMLKMGLGGMTQAGRDRISAMRKEMNLAGRHVAEEITEALKLVTSGHSVSDASRKSGVSEWTIRYHVRKQNIMTKRTQEMLDFRSVAASYLKQQQAPSTVTERIAYEHYVHGMSYSKIARPRGMTRCAVAGHVNRMRRIIESEVSA